MTLLHTPLHAMHVELGAKMVDKTPPLARGKVQELYHPNWVCEQTCLQQSGAWSPNWSNNLLWDANTLVVGVARNWGSAVMKWMASSMCEIATVSVTSKQMFCGGTPDSLISSMMNAWKPGFAKD